MTNTSDPFKKNVVYQIKDMDKVDTQRNITYKTVDGKEFLFDVYTPQNISSDSRLPVAILVHGEAPVHNMKDAGQYDSIGHLVAASGLIAVAFNHRVLVNGAAITEVNDDIYDLIKFLSSNANDFKIDKEKLAIWSVSYGVPFGLYAGIYNAPSFIKCLVAYYGFGDFKHFKEKLDPSISNDVVEKFSPTTLISKESNKIPPLFIARAGLDSPELNASLDRFILRALENNLTIDVFNHASGYHAFDLFNDDDRSKEIIQRTLDFLKKHLLN